MDYLNGILTGSNKPSQIDMQLKSIYGFIQHHEGGNYLIGISDKKKDGSWYTVPVEFQLMVNHPEFEKRIPNKEKLNKNGQFRTVELVLNDLTKSKYILNGEFCFNGQVLELESINEQSISSILEQSDSGKFYFSILIIIF